ncbi:MAG: 16S rRNA (guanine(966)-N(2))-methyltransferase RsmD [SAR324 cluster bacterium]|nr:16S rRNA (guanine(966)-N(2))-methyltransferase RsmD [SAR324 cluster bacterium]|tara:strand:+ start:307 stop:864 length:558 start_codon:yes stop_codon:yes gene_type:complete
MIRIIGGKYRGRKLKVFPGNDVRPTSDQVREALFNLLSPLLNWDNMVVLDLYAGSGALGLEALSRGAKKAVFVEASRKHMTILKQNIELFSLEQTKFELAQEKAARWISRFADPGQQCLAFLDPPFSSNEYNLILEKLGLTPAIRTGSLIVVESNQTREILFPENMDLLKHRRYGTVSLDILRKC